MDNIRRIIVKKLYFLNRLSFIRPIARLINYAFSYFTLADRRARETCPIHINQLMKQGYTVLLVFKE